MSFVPYCFSFRFCCCTVLLVPLGWRAAASPPSCQSTLLIPPIGVGKCCCFNNEVARHVLCQATSCYELQIGYLFANYFYFFFKNRRGYKRDWEFFEAGTFCPKEKCPSQCADRNVQQIKNKIPVYYFLAF